MANTQVAALYTALYRVAHCNVESLRDPEFEPDTETSIWLRGLGDLELVKLWELLPAAQPERTLMANVLGDPEAEIVLLFVPQNFLDCVRNLPESQTPNVLTQWNEMDQLSGWAPDQLATKFAALRRFVIEAYNAGEIVVQLIAI